MSYKIQSFLTNKYFLITSFIFAIIILYFKNKHINNEIHILSQIILLKCFDKKFNKIYYLNMTNTNHHNINYNNNIATSHNDIKKGTKFSVSSKISKHKYKLNTIKNIYDIYLENCDKDSYIIIIHKNNQDYYISLQSFEMNNNEIIMHLSSNKNDAIKFYPVVVSNGLNNPLLDDSFDNDTNDTNNTDDTDNTDDTTNPINDNNENKIMLENLDILSLDNVSINSNISNTSNITSLDNLDGIHEEVIQGNEDVANTLYWN